MTEELGTSSRALLDAARPALGPGADAARRMRAKIALATTGAAGAGATSTASTLAGTGSSSAALGGGVGLATKLGIVAALVFGAGAIALVATSAREQEKPATAVAPAVGVAPAVPTAPSMRPPPDPSLAPSISPVPPPTAPTAALSPTTPRIAAEIEQEMPAVDLSPKRVATRPPVASRSMTTATTVIAPQPPIALSREVALVDHAMAALKSHDPHAALTVLATYATESAGHGQLAEDAAAIEVEALCTLHDPTATSHLAAFDAHFPSSAQRARLTEACK